MNYTGIFYVYRKIALLSTHKLDFMQLIEAIYTEITMNRIFLNRIIFSTKNISNLLFFFLENEHEKLILQIICFRFDLIEISFKLNISTEKCFNCLIQLFPVNQVN